MQKLRFSLLALAFLSSHANAACETLLGGASLGEVVRCVQSQSTTINSQSVQLRAMSKEVDALKLDQQNLRSEVDDLTARLSKLQKQVASLRARKVEPGVVK